jgi:hypothetical protein
MVSSNLAADALAQIAVLDGKNATSMRRKKLRGVQSALPAKTSGWQAFSK